MRRACLASFAILAVSAPAFAQDVTPIPPRHHRAAKTATPKKAAGPAAAKQTGYYMPATEAQPPTTHTEGDYGGVTPGEAPKTDHPKPKKTPPKGTLSWVGFEAHDGGAQLFFQSIAAFDVTQAVEGSTLVVHLNGLKALGANAGRAVDTRFFENPLSRVEAKHGAHGVDVRISFKNAKDAQQGQLKTNTEADGYYYAYLTFPPGTDQKSVSAGSDVEK
jgi:hypothetical protein